MKQKNDLTFKQKLLYGVGEIASTLSGTVVGFLYVFYLTNVMGMQAGLAGLVYLLGAAWDAITDPLAGYISDITRSRFGRRRVYFLLTALPFGVLFFAIWAIPAGLTQGAMFAYALVSYMLFRTASTLFTIPYNTYGMEIIRSYDGRTSLQSFRYFFSILFGLVAAAVPEIITTAPIDPAVPAGLPSMAGYMLMAGIFALPIIICPIFTFLACKEAPYNQERRSSFIEKFRDTFRNRYFRQSLGIFVCSWVAIEVIQSLLLYYLGVIGRTDDFSIIALIIMGTATASLPFWVKISSKLDKKKALTLGFGICAVSLVLLVLPPSFINSIIWFLLPVVGFGMGAMHMIPGAIIPEAIEAGSVETRREASEGVYYGVVTFAQKLGSAVVIQLAMLLLDLSGYQSATEGTVAVQPQSALDCIRILTGVLPVVLILLGIFFARRFKIGREESVRIQEELTAMQSAGVAGKETADVIAPDGDAVPQTDEAEQRQ